MSPEGVLVTTENDRANAESSTGASGLAVVGYLALFSTLYLLVSPFRANLPDWIAVPALALAAAAHFAFLWSLTTFARTPSTPPPKGSLAYRAKKLIADLGGPWRVSLLLGWQNVFLFAAFYLETEFWQPGRTFTANLTDPVDGIYFSVITLFTVGYGDIAPVTTLARFLVTVQVLLGWVTLALLGNSVFKTVTAQEEPSND